MPSNRCGNTRSSFLLHRPNCRNVLLSKALLGLATLRSACRAYGTLLKIRCLLIKRKPSDQRWLIEEDWQLSLDLSMAVLEEAEEHLSRNLIVWFCLISRRISKFVFNQNLRPCDPFRNAGSGPIPGVSFHYPVKRAWGVFSIETHKTDTFRNVIRNAD